MVAFLVLDLVVLGLISRTAATARRAISASSISQPDRTVRCLTDAMAAVLCSRDLDVEEAGSSWGTRFST